MVRFHVRSPKKSRLPLLSFLLKELNNNVRLILKEIFITLLYLTPVGYLLSLFRLYTGERTPGVYVYLPQDLSPAVIVKGNPLFKDRVQWFFNGLCLVFQVFIIIQNNLGGTLGQAYSWLALVFGIVNVVSAIFPTFNWKEKYIWLLIIPSLILTIVYFDILNFLKK